MEDQPEEQNKLASFQEIPMQINPKSSRYFLSHSINQPQINHSEILTKNEFSIFHAKLIFAFSFNFSSIVDYRLNLFEIRPSKKFILIAIDKKIICIKFERLNLSFEKPQTLFECTDVINQIKLMPIPNTSNEVIIALDNAGICFAGLLSFNKNKIKIENIKKFNASIYSNDNSIWSVDCLYPYIVIGGNHKCVMVFNYETEEQVNEKSFIYQGNKHNVPCVAISPCNLFVANNSIDQIPKIFNFNTGELICQLSHVNEWGWGIKFVPKRLFNFVYFTSDEQKTKNQEINVQDNEPINYNENFIKNNLIDEYYILTTYQCSACLSELKYEENEHKEKKIVNMILGEMELIKTSFKYKHGGIIIDDYYSQFFQYSYSNTSRYEYIFISEKANMLFIGNKNGDLHVFEMTIVEDTTKGIKYFGNEAEIIIDFGERLAGMRIIEISDTIVDVYALSLSGILYNYRFTKEDNEG